VEGPGNTPRKTPMEILRWCREYRNSTDYLWGRTYSTYLGRLTTLHSQLQANWLLWRKRFF